MVKVAAFKFVKDTLEQAFVCRRCILRFLGSKEYKNYITKSEVEKVINKLVENEVIPDIAEKCDENNEAYPTAKRISPNPCALCLGILQDACEEMVQMVDEIVRRNRYSFKDFVLQVSLPIVIELREKLFQLYIKEKLGETYTELDSDIPSVKDICKWVIGSQYGNLTNTDFTPFSDFQILISSSYSDTVKECVPLFNKSPESFPNARKKRISAKDIYTKSAVMRAMETLSSSDLCGLYELPPVPPNKSCEFSDIECMHSPLYLGGRYNKYSRELSQTPWILEGVRKMDSSVSELITDIVRNRIAADKIVFSASGREDVDVKMLGNGRPFLLEVLNPKCLEWSPDEIKAIENEINSSTGDIAVKNLKIVTKEETSLLKEGEEQKQKTYSALCIVKKTLCEDDVKMLSSLKDVTLHQKTPIRVLHRRSLSSREKMLHSVEATLLSDHQLRLRLVTQAGTYVKEFVHGDFGRTTPNLGTLLNSEADILELDVEDIDLDWPPNVK